MYSIFQNFNVKRVHSDNGPAFRNKEWLKLMAALNVKVINSSANNPQARGKAERAAQLVKTTMKKILATASSGSLNLEYIPIIVSKVVNQSVTPRTGFRLVEMVFGKGPLSDSFLDLPPLYPTHHLVKDSKGEIEKLTDEILKMGEIARKTLEESKIETNKTLNKNRLDKSQDFEKGDIVYALD
jgi:transposase InsO family protein